MAAAKGLPTPRPIGEVGAELGLAADDLILYGPHKAKVAMAAVSRKLQAAETGGEGRGSLILVSAITPTSAGEGKTTTSIGLAQGLRHVGKRVCVALREPSLGPTMGVKGGATGGGLAQVVPADDINLHFTGDLHAVTSAHNLTVAALDNHLHFGNAAQLAVRGGAMKRVLDMNDRSLRNIVVGLGGKTGGLPRETGFDITAASEVMAVLCLSSSYAELKERLSRIVVAFREDGEPVQLGALGVQGAVAALLRDALMPNLVQTLEGGAALVHGGPFANIAQGANSVLATKLALASADYAVTEAGFGFDLGAEKFFDIVCGYGGFAPRVVVLVATVRALKMHGGVKPRDLDAPDVEAVLRGRENLEKHLDSIGQFGVRPVVAINRFGGDSDGELDAVHAICADAGVPAAVCDGFRSGGSGAAELAELTIAEVEASTAAGAARLKPLYDWKAPVREKIEAVATRIYGAAAIDYLPRARADLRAIERHGFASLPVCIAKTQSSLSDNPKLLGRPKDFLVTVREVLIAAGAGFLVPLTGEVLRMPGLPREPSALAIDVKDDGTITGLR